MTHQDHTRAGSRKTCRQEIRDLKSQVRALSHAEKINETLFEISEAVNTAGDLDELYLLIHRSLGRLIDVTNFYIALHDVKENRLIFPYCADEKDGSAYDDVRIFVEDSLTGEVIIGKQALFLTTDRLIEREKRNAIQGTLPLIWLGVPLMVENEVIGVMAVQSYTDPDCYSEKDIDVLKSVSNQIAMAIERKRINEAVRESEKRFRNLAEYSHDIIMRFDNKFRHLYVNSAISAVGLTPERMIGKTHAELGFDPHLVDRWEKGIQHVFDTGEINRMEFQLPGGIWIDWLLCPEFSDDGRVGTVITFARDITHRKRLEFHHTCFDRVNQVIITAIDLEQMLNQILDLMLEFFSCERAWLLHPCDPDAPFYECPFTRFRPDWPVDAEFRVNITPDIRKTLQRLLDSQAPVTFDTASEHQVRPEMKQHHGIQSQVMMAVYPRIGSPWVVGLHQCTHERIWSRDDQELMKGICLRITDGLSSMLFKRELAHAKNYIDNVINSIPSILVGVDVEGRISQWNYQAEKRSGLPETQAKGKLFWDCFPYLTDKKEKMLAAIAGSRGMEELKIIRPCGDDLRFEHLAVYPLRDDQERRAVIQIDDITEKVRIEEMMIQSEKMMSVGGLAAGMAHEINNPLAGMMQNAQLIKHRLTGDLPANHEAAGAAGTSMAAIRRFMDQREIIKQLDNIHHAGTHAARIVKNMLSFARKGTAEKQPEDLPDLFRQTVDLLRNDYNLKEKFDVKSIVVTEKILSGFPRVRCEAGKLQQVFINILKNGIEAMQDQVGEDEKKPGFVATFSYDNAFATIRIADNGPGIDEKIRRHIFEPFYTTKDPDKGTGLGLSMAYFIVVDHHNGKMRVDRGKNGGSVFEIQLPLN